MVFLVLAAESSMTPLCSFYSEEGPGLLGSNSSAACCYHQSRFPCLQSSFSLHIVQFTSYSHKQICPEHDNTLFNFWTLMTPWTLHLRPLSQCVTAFLAACAVSFLMTDTPVILLYCGSFPSLAQGMWSPQDQHGYQEPLQTERRSPALPMTLTSCSTKLCYRFHPP